MEAKTIGILAGKGPAVRQAVKAVQRTGKRVVCITLTEAGGEPVSEAEANEQASILHGERILAILATHQVVGVLLVGKFEKDLNSMNFDEIDAVSAAALGRLAGRGDMQIGRVVLEEFESRGMPPISQLDAFAENVTPKGLVAGPPIDDARMDEITHGLKVARTVADLDVGQTVVVRQGQTIAVEAAEHSDACIERAGKLMPGPLTVVKVARPKQDFRFDTPVVGAATLDTMKSAGADLLALEAGRTILLDPQFAELADKLSISVFGV
jgi:UDP-2,3-diacylglucosamine hydrolase